jgi:hypothetical protein
MPTEGNNLLDGTMQTPADLASYAVTYFKLVSFELSSAEQTISRVTESLGCESDGRSIDALTVDQDDQPRLAVCKRALHFRLSA